MGCSNSRGKLLHEPNAAELETYVYQRECHLGLHKISYSTFIGAIKWFGYKHNLNE